MTYPGLPFGLMIAVAIGTAIYYYFRNENHAQSYDYDNRQDWNIPSPRALGGGDSRPRTRKRKNSNEELDYSKDCCSICFDKFKTSRTQRLSCEHMYHAKCISRWLSTNPSCPLCRTAIQ
ncbi:hypothetical protein RN001_007030 [Aquatica leii]|uniref:RING-type domain-containing protein n=1 Tax=Aquatica leii TaxID=1421715 RepID=A0AAN7SBT8_9COLE|nr:hypothetical protein RN001_007030 [Aquatica leii]